MDKLDFYRESITSLLKQYSQYKPAYGEVEVQLIFDRDRDHYQLMNVGWNGNRRIRGTVLHLDIKNDKIWIQHDGTERGIANDLLELGISKEDIVLAFHAPSRRKYMEFALG